MLNSLEIYHALNALGYRLENGKFEPSYASEHPLGNGSICMSNAVGTALLTRAHWFLHQTPLP
jgi:hypothetical protein